MIKIDSIEQLLDRFQAAYRGAVVWDEQVPATSNLASTIAGCDDLLPLRFDPRDGSLYRRLTQAGRLARCEFTVSRIRLMTGDKAAFCVDELRIGTTWLSVTSPATATRSADVE